MNYYNEYDPRAAAWLRELIRAGELPPGNVDTRSIHDVRPDDLRGYTQCHFFAGIGGWSLALRLAGWPVDRPVWTGSCPCQPFSAAGKQLGADDERHLWPVFRELIRVGQPPVVFGEQVASALGRKWLAGVRADLEGVGYAVGAADLCAAGAGEEGEGWVYIGDPDDGMWVPINIGPPHIRQRLFWVADSASERRAGVNALLRPEEIGRLGADAVSEIAGSRAASTVANADGGDAGEERQQRSGQHGQRTEDGGAVRMGDADDAGPQGRGLQFGAESSERTPWASGSTIIHCTDGKSRRVEPSAFPLAHGIPGRVGLLRGYGNAIVPQVAAEFIQAAEEARVLAECL